MESIKSYKKAIQYIFSLRRPREDYTPGMHLEKLKKFLGFVGNPHLDYPVIHVGGTAGKGSVTYLTSKILKEHGLKVGTHTSPYLITLNEKFQINLENISDNDLIQLTEWLRIELEKFELEFNIQLSYYESIVAMVFKHYSLNKVDVAVIEVGMGGKLDATNVVNSDIAILTNVGLDHMEVLGDTKEKILRDKVEIMKPNKIFVTGVEESELLEIIEAKAKEKNNRLYELNKDFRSEEITNYPDHSAFDFKNDDIHIKNLILSLSGLYQVGNACLSIQACIKFLKENFSEENLRKALETSAFAGRMQIYSKKPLVIIDGAHNESKMRALAESLNTIYPDKKVKILLAVKKGKDLDLILKELVKINIKEIIITEFKWEYYDTLESFKGEELKLELEKYLPNTKITIVKEAYNAFEETSSNISEDELMLVTGSLYLIGTIFQKISNF